MRRLAKQRREDAYSSKRDYQTVETKVATSITVRTAKSGAKPLGQIVFRAELKAGANTTFVGFGGFVFPGRQTNLTVRFSVGDVSTEKTFALRRAWNRIGVVIEAPAGDSAEIVFRLPVGVPTSIWGLNAGRVDLPDLAYAAHPNLQDLRGLHISPETFYLPHDVALAVELDADASDQIRLSDGRPITLKKCAYCQRLMPLDPRRIGGLSFHKHNAKRTNHQNECRSCKKWRINKDLNARRTVDQLNESSLITRERKIFLREPEILQAIKDRAGDGLKSQVWKRFGKRCFYCRRPLTLSEVQLDHTRPLAYLWPIDVHATCLCAEHNNHKTDRFPVDFYNDAQLRRLARICGLPYRDLVKRELNGRELERIVAELPRFAAEWDARTFAATARKIAEIRPEINLLEILERTDPTAYGHLAARLRERPPSVGPESGE